jgi:hypothetical protein
MAWRRKSLTILSDQPCGLMSHQAISASNPIKVVYQSRFAAMLVPGRMREGFSMLVGRKLGD